MNYNPVRKMLTIATKIEFPIYFRQLTSSICLQSPLKVNRLSEVFAMVNRSCLVLNELSLCAFGFKEDSAVSEFFLLIKYNVNNIMLLLLLNQKLIKSRNDFGKINKAFTKIILMARSKHPYYLETFF